MKLDGLGLWTAQLDFQTADRVRDVAAALEQAGYASMWVGENVGREPFTQAGMLLAATRKLVVATAVANIWARDPLATVAAGLTLAEAYHGRFILGLGVSHAHLVNDVRGLQYKRPLEAMQRYLDAMDQVTNRYRAMRPNDTTTVLGALGPKMLQLAGERTDGAHTYLVPPQHTETARRIIGPGKLLVPEQAVVLASDPRRARAIARRHLRRYLSLPNYTANLLRLGFTEADFAGGASDRLVDALVAHGDAQDVMRRINDHVSAGADHVCVQVLDEEFRALPLPQWRILAEAGICRPNVVST